MTTDAQGQTVATQATNQAPAATQTAPTPAAAPAASASGTPSAPNAAPTTEPLPQGMKVGEGGKVQVLSQSAFKRLKEESRTRGAREALSSLAEKAGVDVQYRQGMTLDEYKTAIETAITAKFATPASATSDQNIDPKNKNRPDHRTLEKWERERVQMQKQVDDLSRRAKTESEMRKEYQKRVDALEAEMELRTSAVMVGIKDPEYALRLLYRQLEGKSEEEYAKFDEAKFFEGLRSTHPYLFGEVVKPATTGTGTGGAPAAPKPGDAAGQNAQNGKVDASKMTNEEFRKHLAARGLNISV